MKKFILMLFCLVSTSFMLANTIHVPSDIVLIQDAIDFAAEGETVLLAPGSYNNIDLPVYSYIFNGKIIITQFLLDLF